MPLSAHSISRANAPDLSARVIYLPIRHHSPACAFHVGNVIRTVKPSHVLIEGPREAASLLPHLTAPGTLLKAPVAFFSLFVDRTDRQNPVRHSAYYPLCDYSPELEALRAATQVGATAEFIDLSWPEMVACSSRSRSTPDQPRSLQDDTSLTRGRWLARACRDEGARDVDDLWDAWFESNFRQQSSPTFFRQVLAWCIAARADQSADELDADGCLVRERFMRSRIDAIASSASGPVVVVTGGIHTVALPTTSPAVPPAVKLETADDAGIWLIRYDFLQLDRLNGYASGMASPEFHQCRWEERSLDQLLIKLRRSATTEHISTADAIAASAHLKQLAAFRSHATPTREDFLDCIRSCFIKGAEDIEGIAVLAAARKLLAGDRVGTVPPTAGRPPIVQDFESLAKRHKLSLQPGGQKLDLDLYRSIHHRRTSRLMHTLELLEVPFGERTAGPDFAAGKDLGRVRELWTYEWSPRVEAAIIEQSALGSTIAEAGIAKLRRLVEAARTGTARAAAAATLIVAACRCGFHEHAAALLPEMVGVAQGEADVLSVVAAAEKLALLLSASEPLEAHRLPHLAQSMVDVWRRATSLVPMLASFAPESEADGLEALLTWSMLGTQVEIAEASELRTMRLQELAAADTGNPAIVGAACGLLYDDHQLTGAELGRRLSGRLAAAHADASLGARFLRGMLRSARSACWQEPAVLGAIHGTLGSLDEPAFAVLLPHLRLAFAELPPRATHQIAASAAALMGVTPASLQVTRTIHQRDLLLASRVDARVAAALVGDGLSMWSIGGTQA